jgi:hypothetical protein
MTTLKEPDFVFKSIRGNSPELATLSVDFTKMPDGVTLDADAQLTITDKVGIDTDPSSRIVRPVQIGTVTNANCALLCQIGGAVTGAVYQLEWSAHRSDGDVAVAVTDIPSI